MVLCDELLGQVLVKLPFSCDEIEIGYVNSSNMPCLHTRINTLIIYRKCLQFIHLFVIWGLEKYSNESDKKLYIAWARSDQNVLKNRTHQKGLGKKRKYVFRTVFVPMWDLDIRRVGL